MVVNKVAALTAVALVLASPLLPASPSTARMSVAIAGEHGVPRVTVEARDVALAALLDEIARLAKLRIVGGVDAARTISVEFRDVPLDRALRDRLLADQSFVLVYGEAATRKRDGLATLMLLGSSRQVAISPQVTVAKADEGPFEPDVPLEQLLLLATHRYPGMRKGMLEGLTSHLQDERARRALMAGASDTDVNVRATALSLVSPFAAEWPGGHQILATAAHDPAPAVRQLVLQLMHESGNPALASALQKGLLDEEEDVRNRAQELLEVRRAQDAEVRTGRTRK
jgi:hypothetical protein